MRAAVRPRRSRWGKDDQRAVTGIALMLLRGPFPQESVGAEDQDQDEHGKDDGVGPPGGDVLIAPGGDKADQKSSQGRALHIPDPAQYGGGKGPESGLVAHPPLADVVVQPL